MAEAGSLPQPDQQPLGGSSRDTKRSGSYDSDAAQSIRGLGLVGSKEQTEGFLLTSLREELLDQAIELVQAMKSLCLQYQSYIRDPEYPLGENLGKRLELADECNDRFRVPPIFVARRLRVAGYDQPAELLNSFSTVVHRFSLLTIAFAWNEDSDAVLLQHDIESEGNRLLGVLTDARRSTPSHALPDTALAKLVAAADLIDSMALCSDDFIFYFEGERDAHEDDDVDPERRMEELAATFDKLPVSAVVSDCKDGGYSQLASVIEELAAAVSAVVHLPCRVLAASAAEDADTDLLIPPISGADGHATDVIEISGHVKIKYDDAIDALLRATDGTKRRDDA